jgi:1,4-dihydroxy-6-naphthoate synthase
VKTAIRQSISFAEENPGKTGNYIRSHAKELSNSVIRQHIDLYVNEFSVNIGDQGKSAITTLFSRARQKGILPAGKRPLFASDDNR